MNFFKHLFLNGSGLLLLLLCACGSEKKQVTSAPVDPAVQKQEENYFPVTTYIRGQINDIKLNAVNPLQIITTNNRIDSSWVKIESLDTVFREFLFPLIDTANLKPLFSEEKFLDNSINAYTWTYQPIKTLPDSMQLQSWSVYVNPSTNRVEKIFMVKSLHDKKQLQLYWLADSAGKIVQIKDSSGMAVLEKETVIKWDF